MNTNPVPVDASPSLISPAVSTVKAQEIVPLPPGEPLKLGIMASGNGSNFEAIAQAIASQQLNARIQVLIYNNPGIKAVARAENGASPLCCSITETTSDGKIWTVPLWKPYGSMR